MSLEDTKQIIDPRQQDDRAGSQRDQEQGLDHGGSRAVGDGDIRRNKQRVLGQRTAPEDQCHLDHRGDPPQTEPAERQSRQSRNGRRTGAIAHGSAPP